MEVRSEDWPLVPVHQSLLLSTGLLLMIHKTTNETTTTPPMIQHHLLVLMANKTTNQQRFNQSANLSDGVLGSFTNRFSHQHEQNPYLPDPRDTSRAP